MPLSGTTKQSGSTKLGYGNYANAFAVWRSWRFAPFLRKWEGDFQIYILPSVDGSEIRGGELTTWDVENLL